MKKITFIVLFGALIWNVAISPSYAYEVVGKRTQKIDDRHTVYILEYAFGHEKQGFSLPTIATRGQSDNSEDLEYRFTTPEGLTVKDGLAVATILSNAPKSNNQYVTQTGSATKFTLLVLHQKASATSRANTLEVTTLPFLIGNQPSFLYPHELKPFTVTATGTPVRIELEAGS